MPESSSPIADQVELLRSQRPVTPSSGIFAAEQRALALAGLPSTVLSVGAIFPDGNLFDAEGGVTTLRETLAGRPGVVIFYRGAWCPYCNIALRSYRDHLTTPLAGLGVALVALSPQKADGTLTMKEKHDLDFAVLSDPGNQIAGALGILTKPSDAAREIQLGNGLDLEAKNADGTTALPMPAVALIDRSGTLVWIDVHPDYTTRTEPEKVLLAVDEHFGASQHR